MNASNAAPPFCLKQHFAYYILTRQVHYFPEPVGPETGQVLPRAEPEGSPGGLEARRRHRKMASRQIGLRPTSPPVDVVGLRAVCLAFCRARAPFLTHRRYGVEPPRAGSN
jgi:hypothetical protein